MAEYCLTEVVNQKPIPVKLAGGCAPSASWLGREKNISPNYPINGSQNPWWLGENYKYKGFGSVCVGRNGELFMITRVGKGHGYGGGELYWSVSYNEGQTWAAPTQFTLDSVTDNSEDMRDVIINYDVLSDRYYLVYTHQYGIRQGAGGYYTDYSQVTGNLKCFVGYEPFVTMYDISMEQTNFPDAPHAEGDAAVGTKGQQCFHPFVRVGEYLYLPFYYWSDFEHTHMALYRLVINDHDPLASTAYANKWEAVKVWNDNVNNFNEASFYVSYNSDGSQRMNMIARAGNDIGYHFYSDDGGANWSEMTSLGFEVAGGPTVYNFRNGFVLLAREQSLAHLNTPVKGASQVLARFSSDGQTWGNPVMISDCSTGYVTVVITESGKLLLSYSKELPNAGIQVIREWRGF